MAFPQTILSGRIISASDGHAVTGANIHLKRSGLNVTTGKDGTFRISLSSDNDTLVVSYIGFVTRQFPVQKNTPFIEIKLNALVSELQAVVVNTGYYKVPRERATGSFTQIDNQLFNRSVSTNVMDRLEGVTNSLLFDRRNIQGENPAGQSPQIRVRGVSTIESGQSPLIVVDNFPYESDITTINPNDVESITILKDAAAASIWGARAGNGVIVITTKQGRINQKAKISLNSNVTVGKKPDLYYNQSFLPSPIVMGIEKEQFNKGGVYPEAPETAIPAYVELLIKKRDGLITGDEFTVQEASMKLVDVRSEALNYLYQESVNQQYALNVSGGGTNNSYYFSAGLNDDKAFVSGDRSRRMTLNLQNSFIPLKGLELSTALWYTNRKTENNGLPVSDLTSSSVLVGQVSPYARLADDSGNALPIIKDWRQTYIDQAVSQGLPDWSFRPVDEIRLTDNTAHGNEIRMNAGLRYTFFRNFNMNASYQYLHNNNQTRNYYSPESYYVRNLVNRFTQADGTRVIPYGGILEGRSPYETTGNSGRLQVNYQKDFNRGNRLTALGGAEVREQVMTYSPGYRLYNYDDDIAVGNNVFNYTQFYTTRPMGAALIPAPDQATARFTDRYLSYFANAAYTLSDRYIVSASSRWDASNIFGVNTNQKGVPLWSVGGSWELSRENFFPLSGVVPYLRLRATFGSSGNVNNAVSSLPVALYGTDSRTRLPNAALTSAGNPDLRWEKVKTVNTGLDFALKDRRVSGSIEIYRKYARDLIGADYMDPTTGIILGATPLIQNKINYAGLNTKGADFQLTSLNIKGPFTWESALLFSVVKNKITGYNTDQALTFDYYTADPVPPVKGRSVDAIYALPWRGLSHDTGLPVVYLNGERTEDYGDFYNNLSVDSLVYAGVTSPTAFGSLRNSFTWKGIQLSATLTWKGGFVFRRNSITPGDEYRRNYHQDYFKRWKAPGDEQFTNVPANAAYDTYLDYSYRASEALITKGDHIRLQDIQLSYMLPAATIKGLGLQSVRIYSYLRNLGILWRANDNNLDPDFFNADYPSPFTASFGLEIGF